MTTIRRHAVPSESYQPDRPLNDLGRDQLAHFMHIAELLPKKQRAGLPAVPSPEDGMASSRFIAAVTELMMSRKRRPLKIVGGRTRKVPETGLAIAAGSEAPPAKPTPKPRPRSKSTPRRPGS